MPATVRGTARPKRAVARPAPPAPAGAPTKAADPAAELLAQYGFEPLRLSTVPAGDDEPELRVPLFSIDGTEYTIPAYPSMGLALEYIHMTATQDPQAQAAAMDYLLGELLGEEGYTALRRFRRLKPQQFAQITAIAMALTIGTLDLPKAAPNG